MRPTVVVLCQVSVVFCNNDCINQFKIIIEIAT